MCAKMCGTLKGRWGFCRPLRSAVCVKKMGNTLFHNLWILTTFSGSLSEPVRYKCKTVLSSLPVIFPWMSFRKRKRTHEDMRPGLDSTRRVKEGFQQSSPNSRLFMVSLCMIQTVIHPGFPEFNWQVTFQHVFWKHRKSRFQGGESRPWDHHFTYKAFVFGEGERGAGRKTESRRYYQASDCNESLETQGHPTRGVRKTGVFFGHFPKCVGWGCF